MTSKEEKIKELMDELKEVEEQSRNIHSKECSVSLSLYDLKEDGKTGTAEYVSKKYEKKLLVKECERIDKQQEKLANKLSSLLKHSKFKTYDEFKEFLNSDY